MDILEMLAQVREQLQQQGRLSYRILKMQFQLNEEQLEVLKEELIDIQELAVDKDGKMLVWTGAVPVSSSSQPSTVVSAQLSVASFQPPTSGPRTPNLELPP